MSEKLPHLNSEHPKHNQLFYDEINDIVKIGSGESPTYHRPDGKFLSLYELEQIQFNQHLIRKKSPRDELHDNYDRHEIVLKEPHHPGYLGKVATGQEVVPYSTNGKEIALREKKSSKEIVITKNFDEQIISLEEIGYPGAKGVRIVEPVISSKAKKARETLEKIKNDPKSVNAGPDFVFYPELVRHDKMRVNRIKQKKDHNARLGGKVLGHKIVEESLGWIIPRDSLDPEIFSKFLEKNASKTNSYIVTKDGDIFDIYSKEEKIGSEEEITAVLKNTQKSFSDLSKQEKNTLAMHLLFHLQNGMITKN